MEKLQKAFTLVELIVVITILAILGTIAFISLQGYSKSSRDSVRISDVSNMKTSLELFHLNAGKYPLPDDNEIVSYSGGTLWYQGEFGDNVVSQLSRNISESPTDPLTHKKYVFSVDYYKNEFQILSLLESDLSLNTISQTNAVKISVTPKLDGNYNGVFVKNATHIVPTPSIITSEEINTGGIILNNTNIKSQVTHLGKNIPKRGNVNYSTGQLTGLVLSVYTGSVSSEDTNAKKEEIMRKIQDAYTSSELANDYIYEYILSKNTTEELVTILNIIVLKNDTKASTATTNFSCDDSTKPADDLNKTYTVNPTTENQAYVQFGMECGYTCTGGYTGVNCNIPPAFSSCKDILDNGGSTGNGVYTINPTGSLDYDVYCDMIDDGGGWTLVMRGYGSDTTGWGSVDSLDINSAKDGPNQSNTFKLGDSDINLIRETSGIYRFISDGTYSQKRFTPAHDYIHTTRCDLRGIIESRQTCSDVGVSNCVTEASAGTSFYGICDASDAGGGSHYFTTSYQASSWITGNYTGTNRCFGTSANCNFSMWVK